MLSTTLVHMPTSTPISVPFSSISDVESVHLQVPNISDVDVSQLVAIGARVVSLKPHIHLSICWGFFFINDGLLVDLVKPQVLWCIICKYEQTFNDDLVQRSKFRKALIKYSKVNDITPMTTSCANCTSKVIYVKEIATQ